MNMVKQKYTGITKRFGSRYGVTVRKRLENVEKMYKGTHKCPYCRYLTVKRLASGIWYCRKCDKKLTGRAYELSNVKKVHEKLEEFEQYAKEIERKKKEAEENKEETSSLKTVNSFDPEEETFEEETA